VRSRLSPRLAATLLSLVGLPVLAVAPRLAAWTTDLGRSLEAAFTALPDVPPDWIARIPVAGDRLAAF
jgi:hypothetical protein